MRQLLEKKKRLPLWLLAILLIIASIFALVILKFLFDFLTSNTQKQTVTPVAQVIQQQKPVVINEEKEKETEKIEIVQNTQEYEKLQQDYQDLQLVYKELLQQEPETIVKECEPVEIIKEREFTEKEQFIYSMGLEIMKKCDYILLNEKETEKAGICKDIYAKYFLNIN